MIFTRILFLISVFIAVICVISCENTNIVSEKKAESLEIEGTAKQMKNTDVGNTVKGSTTWGIIISPIDLWLGNTDNQIVVWHNKYLRNGDVFSSLRMCEEQAAVFEKEHPPGHNMEVKCVSPAPRIDPITIIDVDVAGGG